MKTAVFQEETWRETAARYGIQPPAVGPLRLAKLEELLAQVAPAGMQDGTVRRGLCFGVTGFLLISVLFCLSLGASLNANLTGYSPSLYVALRDLLLLH